MVSVGDGLGCTRVSYGAMLLQAVLSEISSLSGITDAVQTEHILLQLQMCLSINDAITDVPATPAPARRRWGSFWIFVWMQ